MIKSLQDQVSEQSRELRSCEHNRLDTILEKSEEATPTKRWVHGIGVRVDFRRGGENEIFRGCPTIRFYIADCKDAH